MKKTQTTLVLAAVLSILTPESVYAVNTCSTIFEDVDVIASIAVTPEVTQQLQTTLRNSAVVVHPDAYRVSYKPESLPEIVLGGRPESKSFTRLGYAVESTTTRVLSHVKNGISYFKAVGKRVYIKGRAYIEFPNSTSFTTKDASGRTREWVITRGVRDYMVGVNNKTGAISPDGYVSDVLLYERVNGKTILRDVLLESAPELKFLFEDPRISIVPDGSGGVRIILSGTDYSPHKPPFNSPDVMNRYVELEIGPDGQPLPVKVDPHTKLPNFSNLSPAPKFRNGKYFEVDAKNATIAVNELGQIVVRTRLRPNFLDRTVQLMLGKDKWDYAEQVFVFRDWNHFKQYNWNDALVDLTGKTDQFPVESSVRPLSAKEIIRDKNLVEYLKVEDHQKDRARVRTEDGKGLGPGTRPLRVRRVADLILVSDGPGLPEYVHATLTKAEAKTYGLADGEVTYLTFDHEIRKFEQKSDGGKSKRRHYTASVKLFDQTLANMTDYLPDVIQPKTAHELGLRSGILDLQHTYPMGYVIGGPMNGKVQIRQISPEIIELYVDLSSKALAGDPKAIAELRVVKAEIAAFGRAQIRVYAGVSDAHTAIYGFNVKTLIQEAKDHSREVRRP